jgi:hypothetical protein
MIAILNKIDLIYNDLVVREAEIVSKEAEISRRLSEVVIIESKLTAKANDLNAKQRILDRAEADVSYAEVIKKQLNEAKEALSKAEKIEKLNIQSQASLDKQSVDLNKMIEIYKSKTETVQRKESELEQRKKNLRAEILEEMKKSFLK